MRLKTKFTVYISISILFGVYTLSSYAFLHWENEKFIHGQNFSQLLSHEIYDLNFTTYNHLIKPSERSRSQWLQQQEKLTNILAENRDGLTSGAGLLAKVGFQLETLLENFNRFDELESDTSELNPESMHDIRSRIASQLLINSRELYADFIRYNNVIQEEALAHHQREEKYILALMITSVILFTLILINAARSIFPRIRKLTYGFREVSRGNLNYRLTPSKNDEIGFLLQSFNKTVADLAETTVSRVNLENEIKLREESQKKAAILEKSMDKSPNPVIMVNGDDLTVFYANRGARTVLGYDAGVFVSKSLDEIVAGANVETLRSRFSKTAAGDTWQEFEADFIRSDGVFIPMEIGMHYIPGQAEDDSYYILAARDISAQKSKEEQLYTQQQELENKIELRTKELRKKVEDSEQLNRAMVNLLEDLQSTNRQLETMTRQLTDVNRELESFSYSVSHDLRAPLRHMNGFVHLLGNRTAESDDEKSRHYIDIISQSSTKMGVLIDDLLNYSRTVRQDIKLNPVDNNQLVQEIINEVGSSADGRKVEWDIADLPVSYADKNLIRIVWNNLLENALKFTAGRETAHIVVGGEPDETGETVYFVRDNGAGFDMKYKDKLFGVFQRLHRESEFPGTGIGLATVQRIIHRHLGRVWAEGEVGRGATIFFSLPKTEG